MTTIFFIQQEKSILSEENVDYIIHFISAQQGSKLRYTDSSNVDRGLSIYALLQLQDRISAYIQMPEARS